MDMDLQRARIKAKLEKAEENRQRLMTAGTAKRHRAEQLAQPIVGKAQLSRVAGQK